MANYFINMSNIEFVQHLPQIAIPTKVVLEVDKRNLLVPDKQVAVAIYNVPGDPAILFPDPLIGGKGILNPVKPRPSKDFLSLALR